MRMNLTVTKETARKLKNLAGSPRRMGITVDLLVADAFERDNEVEMLRKRLDTLETVVAVILVGGVNG